MKAILRKVIAMALCLCMAAGTLSGMLAYAVEDEEVLIPEATETPEPEQTPEEAPAAASETEAAGETGTTEEPETAGEPTETLAPEQDSRTHIVLTFRELPEDYPVAIAVTEIDPNAITLSYPDTISEAKLSYWWSGNWVEITDGNNADLPADTRYQFELFYQNVSVADLEAAGRQMVYEGLPAWFVPTGGGMVMDGDTVAATMDVVDGKVVITFDQDWLNEHRGTVALSGTFRTSGSVDWRELENSGAGKMPGLTVEPNFEGNLAAKYGSVGIEKSQTELIDGGNGDYYLKYTLTVTSPETVVMPQVTVRDVFANAADIAGYEGVPCAALPDSDTGNLQPWEGRTEQTAGSLAMDGGEMVWTIGDMQPGEERTLTYCVRIAPDYVDSLSGNAINNTASVYSEGVLKETSSAAFIPKTGVTLDKEVVGQAQIGPTGSGTVTYKVTITADEDNSFTLDGLTLRDAVPEALRPYVSGDQENGAKIKVTIDGVEQTVDYANGAFTVEGIRLPAGKTVTVEYTVQVTNLFLSGNGEILLTNTAAVSKSGRNLASDMCQQSLARHTWTRKIAGETVSAEKVITMDGPVYESPGTTGNTTSFTVPKGSIQYQVVLNESGQWDMSSANLADSFGSEYLKYVGYVRVDLYDYHGQSDDLTTEQAIAQIKQSELKKTVWLKVDGEGSFAFKPGDLGITENTFTYLLTYYAKPEGVDDLGSVTINNSFRISGTVGDGEGGEYYIPGIEITVGRTIQGGLDFNIQKTGWYYASYPVYLTPSMEDGTYPEKTAKNDGYSQQYVNGAIYWIIRLDGDIRAGKMTALGNAQNPTKFDGLYIKDTPAEQTVNRDAVVGVFMGDKDFDFSAYESFPAFKDAGYGGLEALAGNPMNEKYFSSYYTGTRDYEWYADNTFINGIIFTESFISGEKYKAYTENDYAIYIVMRATPNSPVPTDNVASRTYTNSLSVIMDDNTVSEKTGRFIYQVKERLHKESKDAYIYDADKGTFVSCGNRPGGDWRPGNLVNQNCLPGSGIYAMWLVNVNWNGTMSGTYDVLDQLPKGMELVYVDVNNFGVSIKGNPSLWPETVYISELNGDTAWREMEQDGKDDRGQATHTITYYNKETGQIHWRISGLTSNGEYKSREINLRVVCRVVDPELYFAQSKTYENTVNVLEMGTDNVLETDTADVTITVKTGKDVDYDLLEQLGAKQENGGFNLGMNQLPFKIEFNADRLDMVDGDTLPTLIDELGEGLALIESSLKVYADGAECSFTYDVNKDENGKQTILIHGLPDGKKVTIKYNVRLTGRPGVQTPVTNIAYWAGYDQPEEPQVKDQNAWYEQDGTVRKQDIAITVIKVDGHSHSMRLDGAVFDLYAVDTAGNRVGDVLMTGTTDSMGVVEFDNQDEKLDNQDEKLDFNTVYCIEEKQAPAGYPVSTNQGKKLYFVIINGTGKAEDFDGYAVDPLEMWYEAPPYEVVIENDKDAIGVKKVFKDKEGAEFTPQEGIYRFGLFDFADTLIQTLTIEYNGGVPKYYLDGLDSVPVDEPHFTKFEPTMTYRVYELDGDGSPITDDRLVEFDGEYYHVTYDRDQVRIKEDMTVTNARSDGSLVISKTVEGPYADREKDFTFTVTISGDGPYPFYYDDNAAPDGTITGSGTITLHHGQTVTVRDLPVGTEYEVLETEETGYTASVTAGTESTEGAGISGTVTRAEEKLEFVNTYRLVPVTGAVPALTKTLTGRDLVNGEFAFALSAKPAEGVTLPGNARNDADGKIAFGGIVFTAPGTYAVTVREVVPEDAVDGVKNGVRYSENQVTFTYEVKDDGKGGLHVSGPEVTGETVFVNHFTPPASTDTSTPTATPAKAPHTADGACPALWMAMLTASAIGLGIVMSTSIRGRKRH